MSEDDILSDVPQEAIVASSAAPWEPWRCAVCGLFVHNLDELGYPAPGAPVPRFISRDYPVACSVCWILYTILDKSDYFTKLVKQDKVSAEEYAKRIKKLGPGGTYFPE